MADIGAIGSLVPSTPMWKPATVTRLQSVYSRVMIVIEEVGENEFSVSYVRDGNFMPYTLKVFGTAEQAHEEALSTFQDLQPL